MDKPTKYAGIGCLGVLFLFIVIAVIVGISSDTTSDSETNNAIEELGIDYEPLDSAELAEKKRVDDSLALIAEEKRKAAESALKSFRKSKDEFEGTTFYKDDRAPAYANRNFIYPYIGQKGDQYWLRLRLQYTADDWLFINHAIFLVDGEKYTITGNWERDNSTVIWEWLDMPVDRREKMILEQIANSESAKVRYVGDKYHDDRTLTAREKSIIKKTLEVYDGIKGI